MSAEANGDLWLSAACRANRVGSAVIARDEADRIWEAFPSVPWLCEDVLAAGSGSHDDSEALRERSLARVVRQPEECCGLQECFVEEEACRDVIPSLGACERRSERSRTELAALLALPLAPFAGFYGYVGPWNRTMARFRVSFIDGEVEPTADVAQLYGDIANKSYRDFAHVAMATMSRHRMLRRREITLTASVSCSRSANSLTSRSRTSSRASRGLPLPTARGQGALRGILSGRGSRSGETPSGKSEVMRLEPNDARRSRGRAESLRARLAHAVPFASNRGEPSKPRQAPTEGRWR